MARKRMIDPSIWTDEGMADLTPRQQLLYIGLFSNADDEGRLKGSTAAIALMLPTIYSTNIRREVGEDLENVLRCMTRLRRYVVDGREYLEFANYRQWQRIDRPVPSQLPPIPPDYDRNPENETYVRSASTSDRRTFDDHSSNSPGTVPPNRKEEKGIEEKGIEPSLPADAGGADDDESKPPIYSTDFEAFWQQYPRGRGSKAKSFAEWRKLRRAERDDATAALPSWLRCEMWQDPSKVIYCERWLKARAWENDAPPAARQPGPIHRNGKVDMFAVAARLREEHGS